MARREDLDVATRAQVRARFDEPVWGDAVRAGHAEAFAQREAARRAED
jgi:hypothetical protein